MNQVIKMSVGLSRSGINHIIRGKKILVQGASYNANDIVEKYLDKIAKEASSKKISGFSFDMDKIAGTWYWYKKDSPYQIYATLGWEGQDELPLSLSNVDSGDPIADEDDKTCKVSALTFDLKKDVSVYLKAVAKFIKKHGVK